MCIKTEGAWSLGHRVLCKVWDLKKRNREINENGYLQELGI